MNFDNLTATIKLAMSDLYLVSAERLENGSNGCVCVAMAYGIGLLEAPSEAYPAAKEFFAATFKADAHEFYGVKPEDHGPLAAYWFGPIGTERESRILALLFLREMLRTERRPKTRRKKRRLA